MCLLAPFFQRACTRSTCASASDATSPFVSQVQKIPKRHYRSLIMFVRKAVVGAKPNDSILNESSVLRDQRDLQYH